MEKTSQSRWNDIEFKRIWKVFGWMVLVLTIVFFWSYVFLGDTADLYSSSTEDSSSDEYSYAGCNVAGVLLHGDLYTYVVSDPETGDSDDTVGSEDVVYWIETAEDEPSVKAILLEIDSYGGYPVAAEEIVAALKKATKPTVAHIRQTGTSAAYWAATGADIIFASELSDVGSISVTQSYIDESKLNEMEGYTYNSLSTGKYKDMLNPEKPLTAEERALLERDLEIVHEAFIKAVSENRSLDINKVRALADGSSMMGKMALENGLIDRIGGIDEVNDYLTEMIEQKPVICW